MSSAGGDATRVLPREALHKAVSFTLTGNGIYAFGAGKQQEYPSAHIVFGCSAKHLWLRLNVAVSPSRISALALTAF